MHRFMTSYSLFVNKKYFLIGRLFQSRYQAKYIKTDKGLLRTTQYIRNNPVKAGLVRRSEDYKWFRDMSMAIKTKLE